ncbi:MAG TPA: cytochrome c oxidase assembly protein [Chloroflexota bacterium]|nr:cytochrome c oxidase assembly protein [Chloroflexota bacterium]
MPQFRLAQVVEGPAGHVTMTPTWSWLLTRWSLEPSIVLGLAALTLAYLFACGYRRVGRYHGEPQRVLCTPSQLRLFFLSVGILAVALMSPLDYAGDNFLFSAHMIQHLVLASAWPPIFLMSLPEEVVAPAFRARWLGTALRFLTKPAVAFVIFSIDITIWHLSGWYDLTLRNDGIHILEHLTFMAAGVLVWWPILSPLRSRRLSPGLQELYLFANLFPMMALGIFFTFWQHPLYAPYIADPRLWGISALTDQQLGGLIMWMPGDLPFALAMAVTLMWWIDRGDPNEGRRIFTTPAEGSSV